MQADARGHPLARFEDFLLDIRTGELCKQGGQSIRLPEQSFQILTMLLDHHGEVVGREEIRKRLWPNDTVVEFEHSISAAMNRLRQALGDSAGDPSYIETLARRGYRWMRSVEWMDESPALPETWAAASASPAAGLTGRKVSHYRVLEMLGGGGMGIVYKAEDIKLGRRVALKFLPEELTGDLRALERFEREARVTSALNHPNICTIHEIEEHDGQPFIVMELLEGNTLRDTICVTAGRKPLELTMLLELATQITAGLEAAHQKGIVHRDIKPSNIFITHRGEAKILDFGVAKLLEFKEPVVSEVRSGASDGTLQTGPSKLQSLHLTRTGAALGTEGYMSPEQVKGETLDARTDLFSFGLVLYEMATGQRTFNGDTVPVLHEAILDQVPVPAQQLNPGLPSRLEQIINKALEKNRERRYQSAAQMRGDLMSILDSRQATTLTPRTWKQRSRKLLLAGAGVAVLLLLAAGFILRRFMGSGAVPAHAVQHLAMEHRLTANPSDVPVNNAVVSPDGKYLAYADPTGLYLRQISSGETRPWTLPKGFVAWPYSWFPDSTHLLVRRIATQPQDLSLWQSSLYELSMLGGEPQEMVNNAAAGYVSPDGSRIAYLPMPNVNQDWTPDTSEMWMMDSDGANPRRVVSVGEKKYGFYPNWIYRAAWSPTGQHLAYIENHSVAGPDPVQPTHSLQIIGPNGEGATVILDDPRIGEALWWTPDGRILFSYREVPAIGRDNYGVYSMHVDERTGKASGPPQPVTQAEGIIRGMSGTADGKRLVLWRSNAAWQVFIASLDAASHQWKEPRRLTLDANENIATAWTADSKAVLFVSNRHGTWKLFKQAIDETTPEVLAEGRSLFVPRLSADGSHVLYVSSSSPEDVSFPSSIMSKPLVGGAPRVVIQGKGIGVHQCARAPSKMCIFSQNDGQDLVFRSFDLEHGAGRELLRIPDSSPAWSLSSDGSKLAMVMDRHRIRFVSLATGAAHEVTVKGWPLDTVDWAANGQTVLMASRAPSGLSVILEVDQTGEAKVVLQGSANIRFAFMIQSPDGRYAILLEHIPSDSNAWLVHDF